VSTWEPIRAAGCVLWRPDPGGGPGIGLALVHRPKWDDWSHPKGKFEPGETALQCAVREVREETGMACVPGRPLPAVRYAVGGRPKDVRYFAARATTGVFRPHREVDALLWLPPDAARARLTQVHDRPLVDALLCTLFPGRTA
jgi:8-oxo-dGTP diphosphatase